jgi:Tol biopolymer transport system component
MTSRGDIGRDLAAYLDERSVTQAPDGLLDSVLVAIKSTRQRPGWLVPDRWRAARTADRIRRLEAIGIVVAVIAAIVIAGLALTVLIGSSRRLPPPFGIAKPGLIAYDLGGDIVVSNADGTERRQLTSGPDADNQATFSPDGTLIAYESEIAAGLTDAVIVMSSDGQHPVVVADRLWSPGNLSWAPDSHRVAFSARAVGSDIDHLYVADVAHPGATPIGPPDLQGVDPRWSPDGRQIAFKRVGPCCDTLWLMGPDGTNLHQLSTLDGIGNMLWNTAWSPDGQRLAFLAVGKGGAGDVYVINADGSGLINVTNSSDEDAWPSWSPDGTRLAYADMIPAADNQGTLVVVSFDGSPPSRFAGAHINSNTPVWSPDGKRVAVYEKDPDVSVDENDAIAIFDPSHQDPPVLLPAPRFTSATWQRLAP